MKAISNRFFVFAIVASVSIIAIALYFNYSGAKMQYLNAELNKQNKFLSLVINLPVKPCHVDIECDDNTICTKDTCFSDLCFNTLIPNAQCSNDSDCDSDSQCIYCECVNTCANLNCNSTDCEVNKCKQGSCLFDYTIPGCCAADYQCDDDNICTFDTCDNTRCSYNLIGKSGCTRNEQCDIGYICTNCSCTYNGTLPTNTSTGACTVNDICYNGVLLIATQSPTASTLALRDHDGSIKFNNVAVVSVTSQSINSTSAGFGSLYLTRKPYISDRNLIDDISDQTLKGNITFYKMPTINGTQILDTTSNQQINANKTFYNSKTVILGGNLLIDTAEIDFETVTNQRCIIFNTFDDGGNNNQFNGFGIDASNNLRVQIVNPSRDHVWLTGRNATYSTEAFRIKGGGGILLPSTGATPSIFSHYSELTTTLIFTLNNSANTISVSKAVPGCLFTRTGRSVVLYIPAFTLTAPNSSPAAYITAVLPSIYRPATSSPTGSIPRVVDNGAAQSGSGYAFIFQTDGRIYLYKENTGVVSFTANTVCGLGTNFGMTYQLF